MRKRRKQKKDKIKAVSDYSQMKVCANCRNENAGKYCSNCGQKFTGYNKPIRELGGDLANMFSLDTSIFRTIKPFLFKPGFLSREYLEGRRRKFLPPLRLYLFLSIVFFFLATFFSQNRVGTNGNLNLTADSDSARVQIPVSEVLAEIEKLDSIAINSEQDSLSADSSNETAQNRILSSIQKTIRNQDLFISNFFQNISYALFILMPVFALFLYLLYVRRKIYYIEHLIFSVNMHSFALFIFSIVLILAILLPGNNDYLSVLLIIIPVYFTIGMKRFYAQRIVKTLLKTLILGLAYLVLLIGVVLLLLFFTVLRM